MSSNILPFITREFTKRERGLLKRFVEAVSDHLRLKMTLEFGFSDEGDEYCVVLQPNGDPKAHFAKTDWGYFRDSEIYGYIEGKTLDELVLHVSVPFGVQSILNNKRKANV